MRHRSNEGIALVTVLLIGVVLTIMVFGTALSAILDRQVSSNQQGSLEAFYIAKEGADKYRTIAFQAFQFYLENTDLYADLFKEGIATCGNLFTVGIDFNRDGQLQSGTDLLPQERIEETSATGRGSYIIDMRASGPYLIITSVGVLGTGDRASRATVQYIIEPTNIGPISNAVFATGGVTNKKLNANGRIYGSVYAGGSGSSTEPVIDSNGNFSMHNFYDESTLEGLVGWRDDGTRVNDFLNLNTVERNDLCARLRVHEGMVELSGSMQIGDDPASLPSGSNAKASVAGVNVWNYESDSNVLLEDGSATVYTDERASYDLKKPLDFTALDDVSSACGIVFRDCLENNATETFVLDGNGLVSTGNDQCNTDLTNALQNSNELLLGTQDINCPGFSYTYSSATNRGELVFSNIVQFTGFDLRFSRNIDTRFEGESTLFVETGAHGGGGDVTIDGDILPKGFDANGDSCTFPDCSVFGIIAEKRLHVTGRNQNRLATDGQAITGLMYAGERVLHRRKRDAGMPVGWWFRCRRAYARHRVQRSAGLRIPEQPARAQLRDAVLRTILGPNVGWRQVEKRPDLTRRAKPVTRRGDRISPTPPGAGRAEARRR